MLSVIYFGSGVVVVVVTGSFVVLVMVVDSLSFVTDMLGWPSNGDPEFVAVVTLVSVSSTLAFLSFGDEVVGSSASSSNFRFFAGGSSWEGVVNTGDLLLRQATGISSMLLQLGEEGLVGMEWVFGVMAGGGGGDG